MDRSRYERGTREKINEAAFVTCFDIRENLSMINASNWRLVSVPADLSHGRGKFLLRDERHFFLSTSSGVFPIAVLSTSACFYFVKENAQARAHVRVKKNGRWDLAGGSFLQLAATTGFSEIYTCPRARIFRSSMIFTPQMEVAHRR